MIALALWLLTAILLLMIAILCLPIRLRLVARSERRVRYQVFLSVLGGRAPEILIFDTEGRRPSRRRKKPPKRNSRAKLSMESKRIDWIRELLAVIGRMIRAFRVVHIYAEGSFGFDDPADTGVLYGYLSPLVYAGTGLPDVTLDLRPDFERAGLRGNLDALLEVTPIFLLLPAMNVGWRVIRARYA